MNKIFKSISIIIIINIIAIQLSLIFTNISFAAFGAITSEAGSRPPPATSDSGPSDIDVDVGGEGDGKKVVYVITHSYVQGNAYTSKYEDSSVIDQIDPELKQKIGKVKIECISDSDIKMGKPDPEVLYTTYSNDDGEYVITYYGEPFQLRFTYGYYDESMTGDEIKKQLKYNGLDYSAVMAGLSKDGLTTIERTIKRSGVGCTQVMLALDISQSAWQTEVAPGVTRLDTQKEAAKKLIEKLLEDEKNHVYVGLVVFAGANEGHRVVSLTNNKERLYDTLDSIQISSGEKGKINLLDYPAGTNLVGALNKAEDSFVNLEEEYDENVKLNKYLVLLSDGAPTTDGNTVVYNDDSYNVIKSKLYQIGDTTHNRIKEIAEKGANVISFIVDSEDQEEQEVVEYIFNPREGEEKLAGTWYHSNDDNSASYIQEDILNSIQDTITEEENITSEEVQKTFNGEDDQERRNTVNGTYPNFYYENVAELEDLIQNFNNDSNYRAKAKNFLDKTYMTVTTHGGVVNNLPTTITNSYTPTSTVIPTELQGIIAPSQYLDAYALTPAGSSYETDDTIYIYEDQPYENQDLVIDEREHFELSTDINVTGYRFKLANGTILKELAVDSFVDKDLADGEVRSIQDLSDPVYVESVDQEISHGAQVDIEYTITIKNESTVQPTTFTLANYLCNLSKDTSNLHFDSNAQMITDTYKNSDYGWKAKTIMSSPTLFSQNVRDKLKNNYFVYFEYINTGENNDPSKPYRTRALGKNGERYIKIVLSKTLASIEDESEFSDSVEIIQYSNIQGIRMSTTYFDDTNPDDVITKHLVNIPGNGEEGNTRQVIGTPILVREKDYAEANSIFVIPPTGKYRNYTIYIMTTILIISLVLIKRKKK